MPSVDRWIGRESFIDRAAEAGACITLLIESGPHFMLVDRAVRRGRENVAKLFDQLDEEQNRALKYRGVNSSPGYYRTDPRPRTCLMWLHALFFNEYTPIIAHRFRTGEVLYGYDLPVRRCRLVQVTSAGLTLSTPWLSGAYYRGLQSCRLFSTFVMQTTSDLPYVEVELVAESDPPLRGTPDFSAEFDGLSAVPAVPKAAEVISVRRRKIVFGGNEGS